MQARSIDEVIEMLDGIVTATRQPPGDRAGYFAATYYRVTVRVRQRIAEGYFDDGARMERLDVNFANRYLEAYTLHRQGGRPTRSWELAFRATRDFWLIVLQHLLLGMNAHLNLDLAVAVARTCPATELPGLKADFDRLGMIFADLTATVARELEQIWPPLAVIAPLIRGPENTLIRFSMDRARDFGWELAGQLASQPPAARGPIVDRHDQTVQRIGETVRNPGIMNIPLMAVRVTERGTVPEIVELLL